MLLKWLALTLKMRRVHAILREILCPFKKRTPKGWGQHWHWFSGLYKVGGRVLLIEGNARASEMASAHSQDEARAHDFEGDMSLLKSTPKGWRQYWRHRLNPVKGHQLDKGYRKLDWWGRMNDYVALPVQIYAHTTRFDFCTNLGFTSCREENFPH